MGEEREGDGGIVVPKRKGSQDVIYNKRETRSPLHFPPLLKPNAKGYNLMPIQNRNISSKPLSDLELYKKAYYKIKTNTGGMTPGVDRVTLDGMSKERLTKIMEKVKS